MSVWVMWLFWVAVLGVSVTLAAILLERPKKRLVLALRIASAAVTLVGILGGRYLEREMRRPRRLSQAQALELTESMKSYARGLDLVVVRWTLQSSEAREFAQQIYGALDAAGWNVLSGQSSTEALSGVSVRFDTRFPNSRDAASALAGQLRRSVRNVDGPLLDTMPGEQRAPLTVYVGEK